MKHPNPLHRLRPCPTIATLVCLLIPVGCQITPAAAPSTSAELATLLQVNAAVNQQGPPCPHDYCLDEWPEPAELDRLQYWDCKAHAVAKADRLIRQHGYDPARLEYVLINAPSLRVTHAALLVDGRWILDNGMRCQVCALQRFTADAQIDGRLPVSELRYVRQALGRARQP